MSLAAQDDVPWTHESLKARDPWEIARLFQNENHPVLQEFRLRGRYQGQFWHSESAGDRQSGWEDRRSRIGFDAFLLDRCLEVRADVQSNDGFRDPYDGLVDAFIRWKPDPGVQITAGKTKALIGHYDWLEPSLTQPTLERSQIFNQLRVGRATGLTVEAMGERYSWRVGAYSNDTPNTTGGSGSWGDGEFGHFKGGASFSIGAGSDFRECLAWEKAAWHIDWLHSERDPGDDRILGRYDDILSLTLWGRQDPWDLVWEAYHASGGDGGFGNVFGCFLQPSYDLVPGKLQLVGRYSYSHSAGAMGLVAQPRYEMPVAVNGGVGDTHHAIYAGAQVFLRGDRLKLMAGAEQAWLRGKPSDAYQGYTVMCGMRFFF